MVINNMYAAMGPAPIPMRCAIGSDVSICVDVRVDDVFMTKLAVMVVVANTP